MRLSDQEWFQYCLNGAHQRLDCNEDCRHGCPACILRPDLNFKKEALDRVGARRIANHILNGLQIPETMSVFGSGTNLLESSLTEWLYRQKQMGVISTICLYLHGSPSDWELADWPIAKEFRQLKESGVNIELTVQSEALVSKNMEIALQLDLHRLAAHATLNHVSELPAVGNALIVAVIRVNKGNIAIAAYDKRDAVPGPLWGLGLENVLVQGPAPTRLPEKQPFAIDRLIDVSAGNAHMIRIYQHPDGQVSTFGHKFWQILAEEAPLTINALHRFKVRTICYTDRYLLTPLSLRLLYEVVRNLPGGEACKLQISTACRSGQLKRCFKIFHTYPDDLLRRKALEMLFPRGQIIIHDKFEVPHARSFALRLGDGRKITILLDQGFGSWYANVALNFDFRIEPTEQVNILKLLNFEVNVHKGQNVPIVLKEFLS